LSLTVFSISDINGEIFNPNGKVVIIGFGIGHIDQLMPTTYSSAKTLLNNAVHWVSLSDSPRILLLIDPSVTLLGDRSLDPDFIEEFLSEFSIDRMVDPLDGISITDLKNYDIVIWSGEYSPLPSPSHSNTSRTLLEFFETGHGVILISDDATWDSTSGDPKNSSEVTRSLTQVVTRDTGVPRDIQTVISTFEGQQHPIMSGILRINVLSELISINDL